MRTRLVDTDEQEQASEMEGPARGGASSADGQRWPSDGLRGETDAVPEPVSLTTRAAFTSGDRTARAEPFIDIRGGPFR